MFRHFSSSNSSSSSDMVRTGKSVKAIATGQISIIDYTDAPSLSAYISTNSPKTQAYNPNTKAYVPDWANNNPVLTPSLMVSSMGTADQINSATVTWYDADAPSTAIATGDNYEIDNNNKTLKIKKNLLTGEIYSKTFIAKIVWRDTVSGTNLTVTCDFTFNRVNHGQAGASGAAAIVAVLSNESHSVPTDANGNNPVFGGASTTISVFKGTADDSANWDYSATPSNITGTLNGRTYTVTGMSADTGYVDITASRSGYASITKRFTVTKNKQGNQGQQGQQGTNATAYWLVSSAAAIGKDSAGKYTPATVTFTAKSQTGSAAPTAYSGRFIISESTDGSAFTPKYTSSSNESSKTHTPSAGIKAVKVQLYMAGGTTSLLDEEIISIVTDGSQGPAGADAVFVSAWAPEGNVFRNDEIPSLTAKAEVYKGGALVTSGVTYQWYKQKTGTADQGAGAGWLKLTSSNAATEGVTESTVTTATLTVTADAVVNTCGFKIVATYNNKPYTDTVVFTDQTDPIMVVVDSSAGNIFKNGNINSRLTCRLYQNGEEIDVAGSSATEGYKYTYTWSKVNADGNQDTSFSKTGKWIDITDKDVSQKAVFRVEIS